MKKFDLGSALVRVMERAFSTQAARQKQYRGTLVNHGEALAAMFPNGITLRTAEDFARWATLDMILTKLSRYCGQYAEGGHKDSIHDLGVYAFILEAVDEELARTAVPNNRRGTRAGRASKNAAGGARSRGGESSRSRSKRRQV